MICFATYATVVRSLEGEPNLREFKFPYGSVPENCTFSARARERSFFLIFLSSRASFLTWENVARDDAHSSTVFSRATSNAEETLAVCISSVPATTYNCAVKSSGVSRRSRRTTVRISTAHCYQDNDGEQRGEEEVQRAAYVRAANSREREPRESRSSARS